MLVLERLLPLKSLERLCWELGCLGLGIVPVDVYGHVPYTDEEKEIRYALWKRFHEINSY